MLIMQPTNVDFQGIADKIATLFIEKGRSIEDAIVEEAKRLELNPEEVKRLVEKTNTACSIKSMRHSDNKKQEFDLASKERVLARTHPVEDDEDVVDDKEYAMEHEEKTAFELPVTRAGMEKDAFISALYLYPLIAGASLYGQKKMRDIATAKAVADLAIKRRALARATLMAVPPAAAITAAGFSAAMKNKKDMDRMSAEYNAKKNIKHASQVDFARSVHSLKNIIEKERQEKVAVEQELQRNINHICKTYRKDSAAFHKLASDYLQIHSNSLAAPYLRSISDYLGAKAPFEKKAVYIDDTAPEMALFNNIAKGHAKLAELSSSLVKNTAIFGKAQKFVEKHSVI